MYVWSTPLAYRCRTTSCDCDWRVDAFGLPAYRYTIDEAKAPAAAQPELAGSRLAWHQLGNDHVVADAFNDGFIQLWSQDRVYQWTNKYDPDNGHYAGGYGYLNVDGKAYSTLYADRPAGAPTERDFGVGYARRAVTLAGSPAHARNSLRAAIISSGSGPTSMKSSMLPRIASMASSPRGPTSIAP